MYEDDEELVEELVVTVANESIINPREQIQRLLVASRTLAEGSRALLTIASFFSP